MKKMLNRQINKAKYKKLTKNNKKVLKMSRIRINKVSKMNKFKAKKKVHKII